MKLLRHKFLYRKTDFKAAVALASALGLGVVIYLFVGGSMEGSPAETDSLATAEKAQRGYKDTKQTVYYDQGAPVAERFAFDPNTADSTQLLRLGLSPYMVRGIYKYRAKGGVYGCAEDFARVPGLTQKQFRELKPYIRISSDYMPAALLPEAQRKERRRDTLTVSHKLAEGQYIVLNTADTTQLMLVPGIGSYRARAIVNYGARLGGYVSVDQLDEIDDFPVEAKKYLVVENPTPARLNVNTLTVNQLKRHPYMGFYRARAIVDYRRMHGPLQSLDQLSLLKDFPPAAIERLKPYVEF